MNNSDRELYVQTMKQLKENSGWYMLLGIAFIIMGTLAVLFSTVSTVFSMFYLGIALIVFSVFEGIHAWHMRDWGNFFLHLFLAVLYAAGGVFVLYNPMLNAITLTLVLAAFFFFSGITKIIVALSRNLPHKTWLIVNGAVSILLGALVWLQWPSSGLWVIGMFVGIDAILAGWSLVMLVQQTKKSSL